MTLQDGSIVSTQAAQNLNQKSPTGFGIVYSVILDETHSIIKKGNLDASNVGAIEFRFTGKQATDSENLPIAHPFDKNFKTLPVRNESVEIFTGNTGDFFYKRVGAETTTNTTVDPNQISKLFKPKPVSADKKTDYQRVIATRIVKTQTKDTTDYDGYGNYFEQEKGVHKLKLYEGDTLIESRFGQSIRFSGYNNTDKIFSPTLVIRNGENIDSKKRDIKLTTEENINKDSGVIVLSSDQHQLNFQPGSIDDKGKSDFTTKPESFENYPTKLIGDQILISSGRLIFSARNSEMIFYSKKNYGFISDGNLSIDNKLGIDINVNDTINIVTNDRDINMLSGNGSIFLGSKENGLEPLVKGTSLVKILGELIDTIVAQQYLTPSGPSKIGPENVADFGAIKGKLNSILSKLNQTT
jgi:hypothetical protein